MAARSVSRRGLLGEFEGGGRQAICFAPMPGEPLDLEAMEEHMSAGPLVPSFLGLFLGDREPFSGGVEVGEAHQPPSEGDTRALVKLEGTGQALLDRHATLEQSGGDLKRPGLRHGDARDCAGQQLVIAGGLGVAERVAGASERVPDLAL